MPLDSPPTNPLVAEQPEGESTPWAGIWIVEDIELLANGVRHGSWIEGGLGVLSTSLDAAAVMVNPIATVLSWGISWLIEHVKPLSEALDSLAGNQAAIAAHAQTWRNIATALRQGTDDLGITQDSGDLTWSGAAQATYAALATGQLVGVEGLTKVAGAMALITECAGALVAGVRDAVRDLIAGVLGQLSELAILGLITAGGATPLVAARITGLIATCASRISTLVRALVMSIRNLTRIAEQLRGLINHLKDLFRRLRKDAPPPQLPEPPPPPAKPFKRPERAWDARPEDEGTDWYEALKRANDDPNVDFNDPRWSGNCGHCALAYELRRRGYDVRARPIPPDATHNNYLELFRILITHDRRAQNFNAALGTRYNSYEEIVSEVAASGPGTRGVVLYTKHGGGGHARNIENVDGVILSPDAQTFLVEGRRWDPPDEKVKEWHYIRTDKLPDPDIPPEWVGPPHD